jgi:anti-sigma B factor antagonist
MEQQISIDGNQVNIQLVGQMFDEDAVELQLKVSTCIEQGYNSFLLNMSELDYIDSSGIAVLISLHKRLDATGGRIVIADLQGVVKELFTVTHLTTVFEIRPEA